MSRSRRAINVLLLISLLSAANSFVAGNHASQEESPFSTSSIVRTIGDEIICDEVTLSMSTVSIQLINPEHTSDGHSLATTTTRHVKSFECVVDPAYTSSGTMKGIRLELMNLTPSFEEDRKKAIAKGKTRLVVRDGIINGPTLVLPDHNPDGYKEVEEAVISGGDGELHQMSIKLLLDWKSPPPSHMAG